MTDQKDKKTNKKPYPPTKEEFLRVLDRAINPLKPPDSKSRYITCCQGMLAFFFIAKSLQIEQKKILCFLKSLLGQRYQP